MKKLIEQNGYDEVIKRSINYFGMGSQMLKVAEELNELSQQIIKYYLEISKDEPDIARASEYLENIYLERVDVGIMLYDADIIFNIEDKVKKELLKQQVSKLNSYLPAE